MAKRVNLRWIADPELSAVHAALTVASGAPCTDQKTEQLLVHSVTEINSRLLSSSIEMSVFWRTYFAETVRETESSQACAISLLAAGCSEMQLDQTCKAIVNRLADSRQAFLSRYPKLSEQLDLRARPLRERWETVGPGLLREIETLIWKNSPPKNWWTPRVTATMVQPLRGGDGGFDSKTQKIWMEAILTDVDPSAPEVIRVAWLMTRLALETFTNQAEEVASLPWSLASVPIVLTAAANLDLCSADPLPIAAAMNLWRIGDAEAAEVLLIWWANFQSNDEAMPVSLQQLAQSIESGQIAVECENGLEENSDS